jgi:tetratricopeptide (TPR) repeat protein
MTNPSAASKGGSGEAGVGYKHPPVNTRFRKGSSGNPKGRPRGRANVASLVNTLMNQKVPVRSGESVRQMPSCEALVRMTMRDASKGNAQALSTFLMILDMAGRSTERSEEEKKKRRLELPRPYTGVEFDLLVSPARGQERQRNLAVSENNQGDQLAAQGKFEDALSFYRAAIVACRAELAKDAGDKTVKKRLIQSVSRLGLLAHQCLLAGNFAGAVELADEAFAEAPHLDLLDKGTDVDSLGEGPDADLTWIRMVRANALMFLGRIEEAAAFLGQVRSDKRTAGTSWEMVILRSFRELREAGHSHSLMNDIEKRFADAGWNAEGRIPKVDEGARAKELFLLEQAEDVASGDRLAEFEKLDEAAQVYRRAAALCRKNLAKDSSNASWQHTLGLVAERLGELARKFLLTGRFNTALECADEAISLGVDRLALDAVRVCALLLRGSEAEARNLLLGHRAEMVQGESWERHVRDLLRKLREAGRSKPPMAEIERELDGSPLVTTWSSLSLVREAADIPSGDLLVAKDELFNALTVYIRCLGHCAKILALGRPNNRAIDDRNSAAKKIADVTVTLLLRGQCSEALDALGRAMVFAPHAWWLKIGRAHALMLVGREEEARAGYLKLRGVKLDANTVAAAAILQGFSTLREAGITRPLMDEVEKALVT